MQRTVRCNRLLGVIPRVGILTLRDNTRLERVASPPLRMLQTGLYVLKTIRAKLAWRIALTGTQEI